MKPGPPSETIYRSVLNLKVTARLKCRGELRVSDVLTCQCGSAPSEGKPTTGPPPLTDGLLMDSVNRLI